MSIRRRVVSSNSHNIAFKKTVLAEDRIQRFGKPGKRINLTARSGKKFSIMLLEMLGEGSFGEVWIATINGKIPVAVKIIPLEKLRNLEGNKERQKRRLDRETLLFRKRHPNLTSVLSYFDIRTRKGEARVIIFEYVSGRNLDRLIEREETLKTWRNQQEKRVPEDRGLHPNTIAYIGREILQALDFMHAQNFIHRDVKPENLLVDEEGTIKLCDFGLMKDLDAEEELTNEGTLLGTLAYAAPEQLINAKRVDQKCDIFSWGATMYEIITGMSIYEGYVDWEENPINIAHTIVGLKNNNVELDLTTLDRLKVQRKLRKAIKAALNMDPNKRPSAIEILEKVYGEENSYVINDEAARKELTMKIKNI